ncbi:MAG: two-component system, OmpR family, sensor kinase, partial [Frankiaceae bacterium]|nr:two-component system, OmpR family, sensor kinase [Frankiaceae bacterium]
MTESPGLAAQDGDNNPAMSPEGDEPPHRRPRVWDRTSLKVKLVATLLLLSAVGLVVSSIAGSMQLHRYLYDRADDQLKKAAAQVALVVENSPPQAQLRLGDLPSQYKIRVFDTGGNVVRKTVEDAALVPDFGKVTIDEAMSRNLRPFTQKSVNGKLGFRVIELPLDDGSGTVVLALPLKDIDDTLSHLLLINLVVGGGVLALLAFLGYAFVR